MNIVINPIGYVQAARIEAKDDYWGSKVSVIKLSEGFEPEALAGLDTFSHVEVIFVFDQVDPSMVVSGARHPRNNLEWPKIGIFAQRGKNRPNRLGSTICRVISVDGRELRVEELDAINGTPVVDLKPVMKEFLPRVEVTQPAWSNVLMSDYWKSER